MANTYVDYTATAAQTDFAFSFPYLEDSHVVVEIDGVVKTLTTDYTIVTTPAKKIVLGSGATAGEVVRVRRDSNADSSDPFVDFVNGSVLTEDALDKSYLHNLYLNEEIGELNEASLQKAVGGTQWDAKSLRIINVADPTDVQDAGTKNYIDTQLSNTVTGSSTVSAKTTFTGDGSTAFTFGSGITLDGDTMYEVAIDGVLQEPTVAYAIDADANTITFTSAPPTSSNIVVVQRGYAAPVTGTLSTANIADSAITTDKLASDSVTAAKIVAGAVGSSEIATDAVTAVEIAAGAVGSSELAATSVSAGAYTNADITVDVDGRLTAASNGTPASSMPTASVIPYAGTSAPTDWLLCYGQAVSRTTYSTLFASISTTYGVGDGSTTFNLPDLRGRVAAGKDDMGGSGANRLTSGSASALDGDTLGTGGGAEEHTLTTSQLPAHTHDVNTGTANNNQNGVAGGAPKGSDIASPTVSAYAGGALTTGGGTAHTNVQPTLVLNYIIKT